MRIADLPRASRAIPAATAAQMAEMDRVATEDLGVSLAALMENASHQIAAATRAFLGETDGQLIVALVGTGNNGGDALGALRHLIGWGAEVDAYVVAPPDRLRPLPRQQYELLARLGANMYETTKLDDRFLVHRLAARNAILDGLLGYSTTGAPRGEVDRLIRLTAETASTPIVAIDLPSGLDPDTGAAAGSAIRAALTVTLALPKKGLVAEGARPFVGDLVLVDIGIPPAAYERAGVPALGLFADGDLLRVA
ncbi:MAG TPA: NAD(P)H-hydrate epimerase [Candidatus Limnocylindria bacterium]|nr:NAD(P)H-hydrate epimerase [Candidatus Limnocylindria bacterium]